MAELTELMQRRLRTANLMAVVTHHARERWAQRFPGKCIHTEFARATRRLGKKTKRKVRDRCSNPETLKHCSNQFHGRFMRMTPDGIVFVIAPDEGRCVIITAFDLNAPD